MICSFITEPYSTRTLVSLCAVSKEWADSARRVLYHTPLERLPTLMDWHGANALLAALKGNSAIAQCVRSLEDIGVQLCDLPDRGAVKRADRPAYLLRGQSWAWSWALAMIKCCPRLQKVGITMDNKYQAKTVATYLQPLPLRGLILAASPDRDPLPLSSIGYFFEHSGITSLDSLTLVHTINDFPPSPSDDLPSFPILLRRLVLFLPLFPYRTFLHLLPSPLLLPNLTDLLIECDFCPPSSDLLLLARTVGPHLKRLEIVLLDVLISRQGIATYGLIHTGSRLPIELFSLFPKMEELNLFRFRGMSFARLEALRITSPGLRSFAFCETAWEADGRDEGARDSERIFPDVEVARVLREGWPELGKCHLGWLPVERRNEIGELVRVSEEREMEIAYQGCLTTCEDCGGYHSDTE